MEGNLYNSDEETNDRSEPTAKKRGRPKKGDTEKSVVEVLCKQYEKQNELMTNLLQELRNTNERVKTVELGLFEIEGKMKECNDTNSVSNLQGSTKSENVFESILQQLVSMQESNQFEQMVNSLQSLTGSEDRQKTVEFFDKFENVTESWTENRKIKLLKTKLLGRAKMLFESLKVENVKDYERFKKTMLDITNTSERFVNQNKYLAGVKKLPGETLIEYSERLLQITRNSLLPVTPNLVVEDLAAAQFVKNINDTNIRNLLILKRGTSNYYQLVSDAITLYDVSNCQEKSGVKLNQKSNVFKCFLCDEEGHAASQCTKFDNATTKISRLKFLKRCIKCARLNHYPNPCAIDLKCKHCNNAHMSFLCSNSNKTYVNNHRVNNVHQTCSTEEEIESENMYANQISCKKDTLLKCIKTTVVNPENSNLTKEVIVLFDDGSTTSYVSEKLSKELKLKCIAQKRITINTFGDGNAISKESKVVPVKFLLSDDSNLGVKAFTMPSLTQPLPFAFVEQDNIHFLSDKNVQTQWGVPDILIGSDYYYDFEIKPIMTLEKGYTVVSSLLGYMIGGKRKENLNQANSTFHCQIQQKIDEKVEEYFSFESIGFKDLPKEDNFVLHKFEETVKFENSRYEVGLPWKECATELKDNYGLSAGRLKSVFQKLKKTPKILENYDQNIRDQLKSDIIEECSPKTNEILLHYLPHQPVIKEEKGKLRIVYDASSKSNKIQYSLNECLYSGPVLLENLVGILLRVRLPKIIVSCDIEKAFLQVALRPEDRDATRFLWVENINNGFHCNKISIYRFKRLAFGLTCSPFLLAAVIRKHLKDNECELTEEILLNIYVDNIFLFANSSEEAEEKCIASKNLFKQCSMNLREFNSNSVKALENLKDKDKLRKEVQKILGVQWNSRTDKFIFESPKINELSVWNKRRVLKYLASFFDPLGLWAPITVASKLFLQNLWSDKLDWNETLTEEQIKNWKNIIADFKFESTGIPRMISNCQLEFQTYELHVFTDASTFAFACCAYLVVKNKITQETTCNLIFAKVKVKPKKAQDISIHRLELLGAVVGAKTLKFLANEFKTFSLSERLNLWTDSSTVLHWLRSSIKQNIFVENRLKLIRSIVGIECRYVCSDENPADIASRGAKASDLANSEKWWKGPYWLQQGESCWPTQKDIPCFKSKNYATLTVQTVNAEDFLNVNRFSKWSKLLLTVVYVFRFIRKCSKYKIFKVKIEHCENVSICEFRLAKRFLLQHSQKLWPPTEDEINFLNLYVDEDKLYRCCSRLQNSSIPHFAKNPIYCNRYSWITHLIIYFNHNLLLHAGTNLLLSHLRLNFWIPRGRRTIMQIVNKYCLTCRKHKTKPFRLPKAPPLPLERVNKDAPFANCGVDYFGPILVKNENKTVKIWGVLFTCLVVRAIHIEIVFSLTGESFINALKRFISRRGFPKCFFSDNGTQLVLGNKALEAKLKDEWLLVMNNEVVQNYLTFNEIKWNFITSHAPWRGGFYERMIGLVKNHLKRIIGKSILPWEIVNTLLIEVESVVNQRPIAFLSEVFEGENPIRPIDYLTPLANNRSFYSFSDHDDEFNLVESPKEKLLCLWKGMSEKLDKFWNNWKKDYLLNLRETQKSLVDPKSTPRIGELVIIEEQNFPRSCWKTGLIVNLGPSDDFRIRSATVRLASGREIRRPINQLYSLEVFEN